MTMTQNDIFAAILLRKKYFRTFKKRQKQILQP